MSSNGGNAKFGIINTTTGKVVVPVIYNSVSDFVNGFATVTLSEGINTYTPGKGLTATIPGKVGIVNTAGKVVVPLIYDFASYFVDGLATVQRGNKIGIVNTVGKFVVPLKNLNYFAAYASVDGFASVYTRTTDGSADKWGFINTTTGKVVVPIKYSLPSNRGAGLQGRSDLATLELSGKWGLVNTTGKVVVPFIYDSPIGFVGNIDFESGLVFLIDGQVKLGGKWGLMDPSGKVVVPPMYDLITYFVDGYAKIKLGGKWGLVDTTGRIVIPPIYDSAGFLYNSTGFPSDGFATVQLGDKLGFFTTAGNVIVPPIYDHIYNVGDGSVRVDLGGVWSIVDYAGKAVT